MKGNKGITLVALIITVIVMLILAGVAITAIGGQNGLINKSKNAATKFNTEAQSENAAIQNLLNDMNTIAPTL